MGKTKEVYDVHIFLNRNLNTNLANDTEKFLLYDFSFLFKIPHHFPRLICLQILLCDTHMNDLIYYR